MMDSITKEQIAFYEKNLDFCWGELEGTKGKEKRSPLALQYACCLRSAMMNGFAVTAKDGKHEVKEHEHN